MKRLLAIITAILLIAVPVLAGNNTIESHKVFNAVTVAASGTSLWSGIDLNQVRPDGYFSLQVAVSGDGTAKFEYLISNDNSNYLEPSSAADIAAGITKTSGPGSDGKDIYSFNPEMARYLKIKITETGGANSVTITAWLAIQ